MTLIVIGPCAKCGCEVSLPDALHTAAKRSSKISFCCTTATQCTSPRASRRPIGCAESVTGSLSRSPNKDDRIQQLREGREAAERRASAARGQVTKIKNCVGHGICPCCNRTFENQSRHMASQHPTFTAEAAE
jgi:hypothetical protein